MLGPGGYIVKPRGEVHAMWNAGLTPARMIEIISPAGFEELFRTVVGLTERGEAEMSKIVELANRYEVNGGARMVRGRHRALPALHADALVREA